jgi:proton-dependent oligopeptide transporter, POT family
MAGHIDVTTMDAAVVGAKDALKESPDEKSRGSHVQELPPIYDGKGTPTDVRSEDSADSPTLEELRTLRRVTDHIPWKAYTVAFIELCERFSYYGTTVVCMTAG